MNVDEYKSKISQLKAEGDVSKVTSLSHQLLEVTQDDWETQVFLGDTFLDIGEWSAAAAAYKASLELKDEFDWAWHNLAVALSRLDGWEDVTRCHEKLKEIKPEFWTINSDNPTVSNHLAEYNQYLSLASQVGKLTLEESFTNSNGSYEEKISSISSVVKLDETTCLITVENLFSIPIDQLKIWIDSNLLEKIYGWGKEEDGRKVLFLLLPTELFDTDRDVGVCLSTVDLKVRVAYGISNDSTTIDTYESLLSTLDFTDKLQLFRQLSRYQFQFEYQTLEPFYHSLFKECYEDSSNNSELLCQHGVWLTPNIIYFEALVKNAWLLGSFDVAVTSEGLFKTAKSRTFQISTDQLAGIVVFSSGTRTQHFQQVSLEFLQGQRKVSLSNPIQSSNYNLEFIEHLNQKPEYQRHLIRESICQFLVETGYKRQEGHAIALVNKLQQYVFTPTQNPLNPELPFQLFFDQVIPIGSTGFFLVGWIHDPFASLVSIEVITDLGFSFTLYPENMYKFERPDLEEHLSQTKYGNYSSGSGKFGFCAYAQAGPEIQEQLNGFASFHGVRFSIKLKSDISIEIVPKVQFFDSFKSRSRVVKTVPPQKLTESMLVNCIGPAAAKLQSLCMRQVSVDEVIDIGQPLDSPAISIIIPIYKRFDFQKIQIASFAKDLSLKDSCEIIYVLDSPWQKHEFLDFIKRHCTLYELPVRVVVMERNSGYSSANNIGARYAKGDYLLLMNSDVFPTTQGWAEEMLSFYQSSTKMGALGGKLLYEDDSLQHAGMFFAKKSYPFWENFHYFKGFPRKFSPAQKARAVPAVTGACLMIRKSLYAELNGLSTEYVIGDFEDSDLCLKCIEKGYENWYYPKVEFYHLERQSVPLNAAYSEGLSWHYNARLHHKKWNPIIADLMKKYSE